VGCRKSGPERPLRSLHADPRHIRGSPFSLTVIDDPGGDVICT
jgi:hypothetical protein